MMKKKILTIVCISTLVMTMLVGCVDKTESANTVADSEEKVTVEETAEIEAEATVEPEVVEEESNTIDVTIEEYVRGVLSGYCVSEYLFDSEYAFMFAVQDVNNGEHEYSNIYCIQRGDEEYTSEEYANGAINVLNVVDLHNCRNMGYGDYGDGSEGVKPYMTYSDGASIGFVNLVKMLGFRNAYNAYADPESYDGFDFVDEGVSMDVKFEYNADIDAMVLKSADGVDIAYFGENEIIEIEDVKFITFTTKFDEGDYVVYAWTDLNNDDYSLPTHVTSGKEINFVTHH